MQRLSAIPSRLRIKSIMNGINITRVGSIPSPYSSRRDKEVSVARRVHPGCSFTAELFFTVPPIIHEHSIKLIDPTDVRSFFTAKKPQTVFFIFISREIPPSPSLDLYPRRHAHLSDTFFATFLSFNPYV